MKVVPTEPNSGALQLDDEIESHRAQRTSAA
jgi:hypothetical protein